MENAEAAIVLTFWIANIGRILAYMPQIVAICRAKGRSESVSCATWLLFFVSSLASALYAGVVATHTVMMLVFAANAACCAAIVGLLCWKRTVRPASLARRD